MDSDAGAPLTVPETGAAQVGLPHTVPAEANWHPPAPLHFEVLPQVEPFAQVVLSRGVPLTAMLLQLPTFDCNTQLSQAPSQTELQQTPSVLHALLLQSEFALQLWPFASLLPH
jgi:hypothetical protein